MSNSPYAIEDDRFQDAASLVEHCVQEAFDTPAFRSSSLVSCDVHAEPETHRKTKFRGVLTWEYCADTDRPELMAKSVLNEMKLLFLQAEREAWAVRS